MTLSAAALWALVIALGIQTGAGIYETLVLVPLWATGEAAAVARFFAPPMRIDSGRRLWRFLTPLTTLIVVLNVVLAFRSSAPLRTWWLAGSLGSMAVMTATFAYFVPVLFSFARANEAATADVGAKARRWRMLNYVRAIVLVASWIAALRAFSLVA